MRKFLLASAMVLAAPFIAGNAVQAGPKLGLTVASGDFSRFQYVEFGADGGTHAFDKVIAGNFTVDNLGTQLFAPDFIDLATFDLSSSTGGTLIITLTGSGFTSLPGVSNWLTQFTGNVSNGTAAVSVASYLDNSDTLNNAGCAVGCTLLSNVVLNGSNATASTFNDGSFALTEVITITTTGSARLSVDASLSDVPEPMSIALLGTGLVGFGLARRRGAQEAA